MIVATAVAAALLLASAAGFIARRIWLTRGEMVFLYPSGRPVPESFNPLTWQDMRKTLRR